MDDDPRAFGGGDLARPVGRSGIDHHDLVEERVAAHQLALGARHDVPDRALLVEGRQDERDAGPQPLLARHEAAEVGELGGVEARFSEPTLHEGGDRAGLLRSAVSGGERFAPAGQLFEGVPAERGEAAHDHDRRVGSRRDRLRQLAEEVRAVRVRVAAGGRWRSAGSEHDEVGRFSLAKDGAPDVGGLTQAGAHVVATPLAAHERAQRALRLGTDPEARSGRQHVQGGDLRLEGAAERVGVAQGELGIGAAPNRHEDAFHAGEAALLHHRDATRRLPRDRVDGLRHGARIPTVAASRVGPPTPSEDDEVGLLVARRLEDALGRTPADAHHRAQHRLLRDEVVDALEEPPGMTGLRRTLGERLALGHLDDAQGDELPAMFGVEERRAKPQQVARRARVGERDEDARRKRSPAVHADAATAGATASPSQARSRYGFANSSSRARRWTVSSACSASAVRVSRSRPATLPK